MKIKIKYNHWYAKFLKFIWRSKIVATVIYPYIFVSGSKKMASKYKILEHEMVHIKQIEKEGYLKFYVKYCFEFIINFFKYFSFKKAYLNISYEKEAYKKYPCHKIKSNI